MIYFTIFLIFALVAALLALIAAITRISECKAAHLKTAGELEAIKLKYKDVTDLELFKEGLSQDIVSLQELLSQYRDANALKALKESLSADIVNLQTQINSARNLNATLLDQAKTIRHQLELYSGEQTVVDCGLYTPVYDFDISQKYKDALLEIREKQKSVLIAGTAAVCSQSWTVNGNPNEGKKLSKHYIRLMLRAFNGESDAIISNVRWNNVDKMVERLEDVYQAINKLGETYSTKIQRDYFQLKLKELQLTYEYQAKLKAEKDEQRRIREQIREEERAQKEIEMHIKDSEDEERRSRIALERAKQELQLAHGVEATKMNDKIKALETQLAEALANKERAKSRAQMTKFGHVYIISNIGSFGESRFKIGMTRRYEPQDRIDELGDASVPFEFDVHAMIPTDNAPQLEASLHERFRNKSVNLVNQRKEFFDVSIEEIVIAVRELNAAIEIIKTPEAKSFRQTMALRGQQFNKESQQQSPQAKDPQFYVYDNGLQSGPFSFQQINEEIASGQINSATAIFWREGLSGWMPLSQFQSANGAEGPTRSN